MWFPLPDYERIPQFWLLMGLLFMSSGAWWAADFQAYPASFVYFGGGFLCCLNSLRIFTVRLAHRLKALQQMQSQAESADQQILTEQNSSDDLDQGVETGA